MRLTKSVILAGLMMLPGGLFAADDLSRAGVFPNPVLDVGGTGVTFDNLTPEADVAVYDADGRLVRTVACADPSGLCAWDVTNDAGRKLAPGIYVYVVSNPAGQTKTGKLAVLR
jgi:hypothetical protein